MVDRVRAFGLPLFAALLILAGSLWAFGFIVDEQILEGDTAADERFAAWLHGRATDPFTDVFRAITWTGNFVTLLVVTVIAVVVLWRRRRQTDALFVALAFLGAQVLSNGMKLGFRRERPFFPDPLATESTFSFPSGHALVSLAVYGSIALLLARGISSPPRRLLVLGGAGLLVLAIGFSRLYLGVHFLSDVLAGFAAGTAWLALLYVALELRNRYISRYLASTKEYSP
jgi:membrane-associated phospholipid phosphatase